MWLVQRRWKLLLHDRARTTSFFSSFFATAYPVVPASLRIKPVKLCSVHCYIFGFTCLSFGCCVSRGILGAVTTQAPHRPPQAAASSLCLSLSAQSCAPRDLPPAAVSMGAFPHQTPAHSSCGAVSCLQTALENSFTLMPEIAWGMLIPSLGTTVLSAWSHIQTPPYLTAQWGPGCVCTEDMEYPWCPHCAPCVCGNRAAAG